MASWIDDITPHNPVSCLHFTLRITMGCRYCRCKLMYSSMQVWLSRIDGHMGLANSLALKLAGTSSYMNDPDGGAIIRNSNGGNFNLRFCLSFACDFQGKIFQLKNDSLVNTKGSQRKSVIHSPFYIRND